MGIRENEYVEIPPSETWWRVHRTRGAHPLPWNAFRHFGPVLRFDPHPPPRRTHETASAWYGASTPTAALAEAFQQARVVDRIRDNPHLTSLTFTRPLRLLNLAAGEPGHWPTRAGGNYALSSADHAVTMCWARNVYEAFPTLDGVRYSGRFSGQACIALFGAAQAAMPIQTRTSRALADPALAVRLAAVCDAIGYRLV